MRITALPRFSAQYHIGYIGSGPVPEGIDLTVNAIESVLKANGVPVATQVISKSHIDPHGERIGNPVICIQTGDSVGKPPTKHTPYFSFELAQKGMARGSFDIVEGKQIRSSVDLIRNLTRKNSDVIEGPPRRSSYLFA